MALLINKCLYDEGKITFYEYENVQERLLESRDYESV